MPVAQRLVVDDLVLRERRPLDRGRAEEAHHRAARRSMRTICAASACAAALSRKSKRSQHRMPSTLRVGLCENRVGIERRRDRRRAGAAQCRSRSATRSSMNSLQPSRSPKNPTLLPMTGPKSSRTGGSGCRQRGDELREGLRRHDRLVAREPEPRRCGRTDSGRLPPHLRRSVSMTWIPGRSELRPGASASRMKRARLLARSADRALTAGTPAYREARPACGCAAGVAAGAGFCSALSRPACSPGLRRRAACRCCRGSARLRRSPRAATRCRRRPSRCRGCPPSRSRSRCR